MRAPWFFKAALLMPLIWCCASQKSSESHADYEARVETIRTEGPIRVTTTVREFGGTQGINQTARDAHIGSTAPVLVREVVRVTERAPIVTTTHSGTEIHSEAESSSKWKFGFALWPWLLGAALLGGAGFVLWRLKPPWLGFLWKLLGAATPRP